jgi:hypothetical protein
MADKQDLGGKVVVRLEGGFDSYPQNFAVLVDGMRFLGKMIFRAALVLAVGIVVAAVIVAVAVS